jgi:hypothetical protein
VHAEAVGLLDDDRVGARAVGDGEQDRRGLGAVGRHRGGEEADRVGVGAACGDDGDAARERGHRLAEELGAGRSP